MARDMHQYRADRAAIREAGVRILDALNGIYDAYRCGDHERAERYAVEIENVANGLCFMAQRVSENVAMGGDPSERSAQ